MPAPVPEPARDLIEFSIPDHKGEPHKYETILLPARRGLPLSMALVKALGEPFMAVLGSASTSDAAEGDEDAPLNLGGLGASLRNIEPEELTGLALRLLSDTVRDGRKLVDHQFDKAYQGNYTELYSALWEVIRLNRLLPLLDTFSSKGKSTEPGA